MNELFCYVCKQNYKNKCAYNDHLVRQKHKKGFTIQHTFWSGLKESKPEIFQEWLNNAQASNKPK